MNFREVIITGEQIQQLANVYLGIYEDFNFNPLISIQKNKHVNIYDITDSYDNPSIVFCYTHRIKILSEKIHYFRNNFVLITHNSDENIFDNEVSKSILKFEKLHKWYSQNVCFYHDKLYPIPIGIANSMWEHGNLSFFYNFDSNKNFYFTKNKKVYFQFNINTNRDKRLSCYEKLITKLSFLESVEPTQNLKRLSEYQFCICPEGNGVDTHRLWEALYLQVIPIVLKTPFIEVLIKNTGLYMIVLNSWSEFDESIINYNSIITSEKYFNNNYYEKISYYFYKSLIEGSI